MFASWRATCATAAGSAYCWGMTDHGEIGIGNWSLPLVGVQQVPLSAAGNVLGIAMHVLTACAWMDDGHVYCWGQPGVLGSKLGDGYLNDRWAPDLTSPVQFP